MSRIRTALFTVALFTVGAAIAAAPATAATVDGVIGVRGPGSVYAGTDLPHFAESAVVTKPVKAGAIGSFGAEVLNIGTTVAQFRVTLDVQTAGIIPHLLIGSTDVTALAAGPGYVTPPLAVGKAHLMTLKLTAPVTAQVAEAYFVDLHLSTIDGATAFGGADVGDVIASTVAGTSDHDVLATSAGQPTIRGSDFTHGNGFIDAITAPTIKVGATALFGLTMKNDSPSPTVMTVELDQNGCTGNPLAWDVHLKFGNTDITASAEGAGWASPTTLPGKLFKLTLSVKAVSLPSASGCANFLDDSVFTHGLDAQFEQVFALTNVV